MSSGASQRAHLTPEMRVRILRMLREGLSVAVIVRRTGVSASTVRKVGKLLEPRP